MLNRPQISVDYVLLQGAGILLANPLVLSVMVVLILWNVFAYIGGIPTLIIGSIRGLPKDSLQVVVDLLVFPFLNAIVIQFVYESIKETSTLSMTENVRIAAGRYPALLGLNAIFVVVGYISEIMPVAVLLLLYPLVKLTFAYQEVVINHTDVAGALGASWELTEGNWWRLFFILLVTELINIPFFNDPSKLAAGTVGWVSTFWMWCVVTCAYSQLVSSRQG